MDWIGLALEGAASADYGKLLNTNDSFRSEAYVPFSEIRAMSYDRSPGSEDAEGTGSP